MKKNEMKNEDLIQLIDTYPGSMILSDLNGKILAINSKLADVFQTDREQLIGKSGFDHVDDEAGKRRAKVIREVIQTKTEKELIDQERNRWWKAKFIPILNSSNQVEKLAYYIQDITEEKNKAIQEVLEKENYFLSLQEQVSDVIAIINEKGRAIYIAPSLEKILGYKPDERKNKDIFEITHPEEIEELQSYFEEVLNKPGLSRPIVHRLKDKTGNWHYFETMCNNQLPNENIKGIILNSRDITERKRGEQKLRESEKKYRTYINNSPDGILVIDEKGKFIEANPAVLEILGYPKKEMLSLSIDKLISKENLEQAKHDFKHLTRYGKISTDHQVYNKDGSKQWWHVRAVKLSDTRFLAFVHDITDRKQAEIKLHETTEYLNNVIENTNEVVFAINKENKVTLWNKAMEGLTGIQSRKILKKEFSEFAFIENEKDMLEVLTQDTSNKEKSLDHIIIKSVNGSTHILQPSLTTLTNNEGMITDFVFICNDITPEIEIHGNILVGTSYIINDPSNRNTLTLCYRLLHKKKNVLFITRKPVIIPPQYLKSSYLHLLIMSSLEDSTSDTVKTLNELEEYIHQFIQKNKNHAIIIDRTDYLLNISTFEKLFPALYEINDLVKKHQAMFFIRLNPKLFSDKEYAYIKEEFQSLPSQQLGEVFLSETLIDMLQFINLENLKNKIINQNILLKKFNISKLTAQKRIEELIEKKLIISRKKGRSKQLYITENGKELIKNTNMT